MPPRARLTTALSGLLLGIFATGAAPAVAHRPGAAQALSKHPVGESHRWRGYVLDSPTRDAYPRHVTVYGDASLVRSPQGLEHRGGRAMTITNTGTGSPLVVADLGLDVGGRVNVAVKRATGGPLRISYSESPDHIGPEGDTRNVPSLGINDDPNGRFDLIDRPGLFRTKGIRGAERYLAISLDGPGEYTLDFARVRIRHLRPGPRDYAGRFLSSSRLLNRIWYAGAYTLDVDTVRDPRFPHSRFKLVDGGKRDRLVWSGDLTMEALAAMYTVRQMPRIVERTLNSFACQQYRSGYIPMATDVHASCPRRPGPANGPTAAAMVGYPTLVYPDRLPAYTPMWVIAVADHFELTGDRREARLLLPVMRRTLRYLHSHSTPEGLFVTPSGAMNWRSFDTAAGVDADTNALWIRALRRLAYVERWVGSRRRARRLRAHAARLSAALRTALFDPAAGLFRANLSSPLDNHPQDASVDAILAGALKGRDAVAALDAIKARLWTPNGPLTGEIPGDPYVSRYISPFISGWELLARLQHHQGRAARELLRDVWGPMMTSGTRTTLWEAVDPNGGPASFKDGQIYSGRTSLAHGWSTGPVVGLIGYVGGLRPLAPGWRRWKVEPQLLGLRFCQARTSTPGGPISSRWVHRHGSFRLTVVAPRRSRGVVALPLLGESRTIAMDGRVVWRGRRAVPGVHAHERHGYVRIATAGGAHTYAWSR